MGRTWPIPNNDTTLYCNSLYVTSLGCVVITMNGENLQADKRKRRVVRRRIPKEVVENVALNRAIGRLPANYNFEIHKSVWRIQEVGNEKTEKKLAVEGSPRRRFGCTQLGFAILYLSVFIYFQLFWHI